MDENLNKITNQDQKDNSAPQFQPPKIDYKKVAEQYEEKEQDVLINPIRTYKQDLANTVKTENLSSIQIAIKESQKRQREENNLEEQSVKNPVNMFFVVASLVLVVLGGGSAWYFYGVYNKNKEGVPEVKTIPRLIQGDYRSVLNVDDLGGREIVDEILKEKTKITAPLGSLIDVVLILGAVGQERILPIRNFLDSVTVRMPDDLKRSFGEDYFIGFHTFGNNEPFLIFPVTTFSNTYAGMLKWEIDIENDLAKMFDIDLIPVGSGEEKDVADVLERRIGFEDLLIENKDARVLRNRAGEIIIAYSFYNDKRLVITTNKTTMKKVFEQLRIKELGD